MHLLDKVNSPRDLKRLSPKALNRLCREIRSFLVESVSRTGGHLASNLGVVELTVALHYCFNSPEDKILWDVGHQAYVHKILTGRKDAFGTLRKLDGLSGFPKKKESPHDFFDTGHSSTSISSALGLATARDLKKASNKVVAVIGDGSMTGGLSYEALNNAGRSNTDLMVVLNDNQMSIAENVGAISRHLSDIRTDPSYIGAKADVNKILNKMPVVGSKVGKIIEKAKDGIKYMLVPGILFEEMGFTYVGPIDGHDMAALITVMNKAKKLKGPVLLHVYTKKGKGYQPSEKYPSVFHGVDPFDIETGRPVKTKIWDSYSDVFGKTLLRLAQEDPRIVAITAAMPDSTGLAGFGKKLPERMFDVGIAEGHAVTFAGGLAAEGLVPVFAVYSSFFQRGYDQLIHDICIQNSHVVFAVDRAGIVGADGETHQGLFDLSFLTHLPNMTVMSPKNKRELKDMLAFAVCHDGPVAIRYPKGSASLVLGEHDACISHGKAEIIDRGQGGGIALVSFGCMMDSAYDLYQMLREDGLSPALINARFAKPLDMEMVHLLSGYDNVFTFEDNVLSGGFGSCIMEAMELEGCFPGHITRFGFPDEFVPQGSREQIFDLYGLTAEKMYQRIKDITGGGRLKNEAQ